MSFPLQRIEAFDTDTGVILVTLTKNLNLGAKTIAAIYKEWWQMEIFFKVIKQNLKIKTFGGTNLKAVKILALFCFKLFIF